MMTDEFKPYDNTTQHKEIDLVQSQITRMSNLGMTVKVMSVAISGFLFALAIQNNFSSIALILILWVASIIALKTCKKLEYNYLKTENIYRVWFDFLVNNRHKTNAHLFELNPTKLLKIVNNEPVVPEHNTQQFIEQRTKNSWAIKPFYKGMITMISLVYLVELFEHFCHIYNIYII